MLRFKYRRIERPRPLGPKTLPVIPIKLTGKNGGQFETAALVDSGADYSVIFDEHAQILGIDTTNLEKIAVQGIGGKLTAAITTTTIELKGPGEHRKFTLEIPLMILPKQSENHPILLGRAGFFEKFEVKFNETEKAVMLKPLDNNDW